MRQGDNEQVASRVTYELEEQTASAVWEEELRTEYARAADNLRAELSAALPAPRTTAKFFAQARLRTVESALGTEHAQAQQNLQQQYLTQVQGLQCTMNCRLLKGNFLTNSHKREPRKARKWKPLDAS